MRTSKELSKELGYSLAPWLSVCNGARAVDFYQSAFGAVELYRGEDYGLPIL